MFTIKPTDRQKINVCTNKLIIKGSKEAHECIIPAPTALKSSTQKVDTAQELCNKKEQFLFEIY